MHLIEKHSHMTPPSSAGLLLVSLMIFSTRGTAVTIPGTRILEYLHARNEGLDRIWPQPISSIYISANWTDAGPTPDFAVTSAVDQGFNVIILT